MPKTKKSIHVVPADEGWRVEREGQQRAVATAKTQKEAAERGREVARKDKSSSSSTAATAGSVRSTATATTPVTSPVD